MKKQMLAGARNFVGRLAMFAAMAGAAVFAASCSDDDPNAERGEFIRVYSDPDDLPVDEAYVDVRGGQAVVYVQSNVAYDVYWQDSGTTPWAEIADRRKSSSRPGFDEIVLDIEARATYCYYTRRTGSLMFSSPDNMLGRFIPVHQGATARISQAFAWLTYGSADPLLQDGEKSYSGWTAVQKNYNWTTSTPEYCFGRNGYVKLGDAEGHGADFITPLTNDLRSDSLLMVSFRAKAYTGADNITDDNTLTVNIVGGGEFIDSGLTTRQIEIGTYTVEDGALSGSMWTKSNYLLFLVSTENNPITSSTQIQFVAGSLTEEGSENNRIFLDNIYVYTLNELNDNMIEVNEGTDEDIILGSIEEESVQ